MLADDAAARRTSPGAVAAAITRLGAARQPAPAARDGALLAAAGGALTQRVRRLLDPPAPGPRWLAVLAYPAALALVAMPTVLLLRP
jgi:hypothetical protein